MDGFLFVEIGVSPFLISGTPSPIFDGLVGRSFISAKRGRHMHV